MSVMAALRRRNVREEPHPAWCSLRDVKREERDERSRKDNHQPDELLEMDGALMPTEGNVGKRGFERSATSRV